MQYPANINIVLHIKMSDNSNLRILLYVAYIKRPSIFLTNLIQYFVPRLQISSNTKCLVLSMHF